MMKEAISDKHEILIDNPNNNIDVTVEERSTCIYITVKEKSAIYDNTITHQRWTLNQFIDKVLSKKDYSSKYIGDEIYDEYNTWIIVNTGTDYFDLWRYQPYQLCPFDSDRQTNKEKKTYANSSLRKWLNDEFYKQIPYELKKFIIPKDVTIHAEFEDVYYYSENCGDKTCTDESITLSDNVWLLTATELGLLEDYAILGPWDDDGYRYPYFFSDKERNLECNYWTPNTIYTTKYTTNNDTFVRCEVITAEYGPGNATNDHFGRADVTRSKHVAPAIRIRRKSCYFM